MDQSSDNPKMAEVKVIWSSDAAEARVWQNETDTTDVARGK